MSMRDRTGAHRRRCTAPRREHQATFGDQAARDVAGSLLMDADSGLAQFIAMVDSVFMVGVSGPRRAS
jgi:hypothetical protein